jgi:Co/Zn/Cd efflux system component
MCGMQQGDRKARGDPILGASSRALAWAILGVSLALAATKLAALTQSGSSVMLASAVQSLLDACGAGLLLHALRAGGNTRPPATHGARQAAVVFWSFVTGVLLYGLGAGVALYEGAERLAHPAALNGNIRDIWIVGLGAAAAGLAAFLVARSPGPHAQDGLGEEEDEWGPRKALLISAGGAFVGHGLGLAVLIGARLTGQPELDAAGAVAIGLVMAAVAALMAVEVKRELLLPAGGRAGETGRAAPAIEVPAAPAEPSPVPLRDTTVGDARPSSDAVAKSAKTAGEAAAKKPPVQVRQGGRKGRGRRR